MRNSIYDLEDARLEIGSVTTTPSFKGKPGVGFTTNSTPYAFLLRDFTSEVFGNNTQVIEWSHTHNMNDYKDAGTYRIKGERTGNPMSDNLPIMNQGSGHTIEGVLYVLDSSLANGSGKQDDCTVTQFLMLSNRVGGQEGDMYMRSAYGPNKDSLTWKPWEKYQTNMEVGFVSDEFEHSPTTGELISNKGMNSLVDSGIYSGVYLTEEALSGDYTKAQTFVMVVINNYAAAGDYKTFTQIKFAVTNAGEYSMERRSRGFDGKWSGWINEYNDLSTRMDEAEKKQLSLSVKDNGNIILSNANGESKEFMPATPSGDPMHYAYELLGQVSANKAKYNSGDDYIIETIWGKRNLVDDVEYNAKWGINVIPSDATFIKTLKYKGIEREIWEFNHPIILNRRIQVVADYASDGTKIWDDSIAVARGGMWYLFGLADLTNDDMRKILMSPALTETTGSGGTDAGRVVCKNGGMPNYTLPQYFLNGQNPEVVAFGYAPTTNYSQTLSCKYFYSYVYIRFGANLNAPNLQYIRPQIDKSMLFNAPNISAKSIVELINITTATVTITFPSALYDRLMDTSTALGAELVALFESKSNITFARGE